jgi:hypothetical protein
LSKLILAETYGETPSYSQREESTGGYGQRGNTYQQASYNTSSRQSGRGDYEDTSVQDSFSNLNVRDVLPPHLLTNNKDEYGSSSRREDEDSQEYRRY